MVDRSAWWRTGAGLAAWLVLAVATAGVAWAAVGVVSEQGDDPAPVAVPVARTSESPDTTATETTTSSTPSPDDDPTASETETEPETQEPPSGSSSRVFSSLGGSVSVECTGSSSIRLVLASPATGWQMSKEKPGPEEVEVEFARGEDEVRTRARCDGGVVEGEAESD